MSSDAWGWTAWLVTIVAATDPRYEESLLLQAICAGSMAAWLVLWFWPKKAEPKKEGDA